MKTDGIKLPTRRSTRQERSTSTAPQAKPSRTAVQPARTPKTNAQPAANARASALVEAALQKRLHIRDPLNPEFADLCRRVEEALNDDEQLKALLTAAQQEVKGE